MTTGRQPRFSGYRFIHESDGRRAGLLLADRQTGEEWTARLVKYSADIRSLTDVVDSSANDSPHNARSSPPRLIQDARGRIWRLQRHDGRVLGRKFRLSRDPKVSELKSKRAFTAVTLAGCLVGVGALALPPNATDVTEPVKPAFKDLPADSAESVHQPEVAPTPSKMLVFGGVGVTLLGDPNQTPAIVHTKLP